MHPDIADLTAIRVLDGNTIPGLCTFHRNTQNQRR